MSLLGQAGTELKTGVKVNGPAPADYWYRPEGSNGYDSAQDACDQIDQSIRIGRTVLIAGEEWSWGTDTSNAGLKKKQASGGLTEIADGSITTPKLADSAVTSSKIKDDAIGDSKLGTDVKIGGLTALRQLLAVPFPSLNPIANIGSFTDGLNWLYALVANLTTNKLVGGPFRYKTLAELNAVSTNLAIYPSSARVYEDGVNTGLYTRNSNGTAWIKDTATEAQVVATFPQLTSSTPTVVDRTYRFTLDNVESLFRAKTAQNAAGTVGGTVLPVAADKLTNTAGPNWVGQSTDVASGQTAVTTYWGALKESSTSTKTIAQAIAAVAWREAYAQSLIPGTLALTLKIDNVGMVGTITQFAIVNIASPIYKVNGVTVNLPATVVMGDVFDMGGVVGAGGGSVTFRFT
ncbi:hypothetical protein GCM10027346_20900 [Hymenobacter seoulensis]